MKKLKYFALIALLGAMYSCRESLPEDTSREFAANVVCDTYKEAIQPPLTDISTLHKASAWLESSSDDSARYGVEDAYFSKIAPRAAEGTIAVITPNSTTEILITHNDIPLTEVGAEWSMAAEGSASTKCITVRNVDGDSWLCTQQEVNGDVTMRFTVQWKEIDSYTITMDGHRDALYANSPIVAQQITSQTALALKSPYLTPYPIGIPLAIVDGRYNIKLLSKGDVCAPGDEIAVKFQDDSAAVHYFEYYDTFDPQISFRGNTFHYSDLFTLFYYE